jgi:hypothetical protein
VKDQWFRGKYKQEDEEKQRPGDMGAWEERSWSRERRKTNRAAQDKTNTENSEYTERHREKDRFLRKEQKHKQNQECEVRKP